MQEGQPARLEHRPGCCRGGPGLTRQLSGTEASGGGNVQSPPDQPRLRVPPLSQASALSVCCFHLPGMTFLSPTSRISLQRRLSTRPSPSLPRAAATFQVQLCVELIHSRMSFPPRPRPLWGRDCSAYFFLDSTVLVLIESHVPSLPAAHLCRLLALYQVQGVLEAPGYVSLLHAPASPHPQPNPKWSDKYGGIDTLVL